MRRAIHKIHRWTGLAALVFILLEALTGVAVSFHDEIHRAFYPTLSVAEAAPPRLPMDRLIANLRERMPEVRIQRAVFSPAADEPIWFRVVPREGPGARQFVLINPVNGSILTHGGFGKFPCELALTLHASFLAGETGGLLVGISGVVLFALGITGVVLWWPRAGPVREHLKIRWRAQPVVLLMDLHKVVGIFAVAALLLLAFTGAAIALRPWLPDAPRQTQSLMRQAPSLDASAPLEGDIAWARNAVPHATVMRVFFSDRPDGIAVSAVRLTDQQLPHARAYHELRFDSLRPEAVTLSRYQSAGTAARTLDWMLPIHAGEFAGFSGRLVVFVAGWCALLICVSGVWMWMARRALKRRSTRRLAAAQSAL